MFCCKCAAKCANVMINGQIREQCPDCGFVYFRNPLPGVAVILTDVDKIALGKRSDSGKWCIPCGYIEYGESFIDASVREVKEEIGIDSEPQKIINVVSNNLASSSSIAIVVVSRPLSYELCPDGIEIMDANWFDIAGTLPDLHYDADRYIIGKLKECLTSHSDISGILLSERQTSFT